MSTAFIFLLGALGGSSEADRGQFHQEKVISTASIFLLLLLVSLGALKAAQGQRGGSFIKKKLCPRHLFFFEYLGD